MAFDVALHGATLLVVVVYFWKDVCDVLSDFVESIQTWISKKPVITSAPQPPHKGLWVCILITMIPTGLIAVFFKNFFEHQFSSLLFIALRWLVMGDLVHLEPTFPKGAKRSGHDQLRGRVLDRLGAGDCAYAGGFPLWEHYSYRFVARFEKRYSGQVFISYFHSCDPGCDAHGTPAWSEFFFGLPRRNVRGVCNRGRDRLYRYPVSYGFCPERPLLSLWLLLHRRESFCSDLCPSFLKA